MPFIDAPGARLHVEDTGQGHPVVFVHEFGSDHREWEAQVRHFSRAYRCITFAARGYPPSEVPEDPGQYGWEFAADDIAAVMRGLGVARAHVVGLSMGGYATLMFGLRHPEMASALVVAGAGSGSALPGRERWLADARRQADGFHARGMAAVAEDMGNGPTRIQLRRKDPRGWEEFMEHLRGHSAVGMANTMARYQAMRPSLEDFREAFARLTIPVLLAVGDEDEPCLDTNMMLKRAIPSAGLWICPNTGHAINLEEPGAFNAAVDAFFAAVAQDRWGTRPPRPA